MTAEPHTGKSTRPSAAKIAVNFALVYVLWGSTYLGIRIADESIRPLVLGSVRFATAGVLLLAWCWFARRRVTISASDAFRLAVIGILLLTGGNTTLAWAELSVPSGLAALIVAITPLWVMILDWLFYRERLSARGLLGIGLGIVGIAVLLWPQLATGGAVGRRELVGATSLLFGSASWALGSVLSRHWKLEVDPLVASGYEMTFSGVFNTVLALLFGEFARSTWAPRSVGAVAYLIVFGSFRIVDRIQRLHLAARTRTDIEGCDVCIRQPCDRCLSRMADPARARRRFRAGGRGRHRRGGGPRQQRQNQGRSRHTRSHGGTRASRLRTGRRLALP
jgi:drug/metabolite transporter (DMT)-like permease